MGAKLPGSLVKMNFLFKITFNLNHVYKNLIEEKIAVHKN